jgi:hypothetical protein
MWIEGREEEGKDEDGWFRKKGDDDDFFGKVLDGEFLCVWRVRVSGWTVIFRVMGNDGWF